MDMHVRSKLSSLVLTSLFSHHWYEGCPCTTYVPSMYMVMSYILCTTEYVVCSLTKKVKVPMYHVCMNVYMSELGARILSCDTRYMC